MKLALSFRNFYSFYPWISLFPYEDKPDPLAKIISWIILFASRVADVIAAFEFKPQISGICKSGILLMKRRVSSNVLIASSSGIVYYFTSKKL